MQPIMAKDSCLSGGNIVRRNESLSRQTTIIADDDAGQRRQPLRSLKKGILKKKTAVTGPFFRRHLRIMVSLLL